MENRTEKKTVSTVDMTTEVFKAMSQGSASSIRCLYQIAFSGRLLPKQKPEQHKDSTLTMLQHIEDPEAWEKIYKLVNVLWLKEATYRTVGGYKISLEQAERAMETEQLERIADALEGISGHLSRLTSCIGSSGAFCIAGDVLVEVDKVK